MVKYKVSMGVNRISIYLCCCILFVTLFFSFSSYADEGSVTTTTIEVPTACTINGAGTNSHTGTIANGRKEEDIGQTYLRAFCNDSGGFAIYAVGYSDDTIGNTYLRNSSLGQANDILTGITLSGNTSAWAMKLTATHDSGNISGDNAFTIDSDTEGSFENYHTVPNTYTKVAHKNISTDMNKETGGVELTTTYAVYIGPAQKAGSYSGRVKYTLVHPATEIPTQPQITQPGQICYYANASNVEGTMGCQSISASSTSALLFASNFSRAGYGFAGWTDAFDYATNSQANFYGPNETISFTAGQYTGDNQGLSLYAVWVKSAGYFQDNAIVSQLCDSNTNSLAQTSYNAETGVLSANLSSISALTHQRDNQTYAIAKLTDGNCWMIENLRLDNTPSLTTLNTNNPLNDNNSVNPTVILKHNYTDTQTYDTLSATSSIAYDADTAPEGWCNESSAACINQSRLRTDNTANRIVYTAGQSMSSHAVNLYSYGNYYNWYSATAGRGTYEKNRGDTEGDICPYGWKLPYGNIGTSGDNLGGTSGGFSYLDKSMGGTGKSGSTNAITSKTMSIYWRQFPNNYVYAGYMAGSSIERRGSTTINWSSTSYGQAGAYTVFINDGGLRPGQLNSYDNDKDGGKTLRCVLLLRT